jgi:type I restriction enzyme R subunit
MTEISEQDVNTLIDEHLRARGWDLRDFSIVRRNRSLGELFPEFKGRFPKEAALKRPDYAFFLGNSPPVFLEAKRPHKDLYGALQEAKEKATLVREHTGIEVYLVYASDGRRWLRQNLKARTLPERLDQFPTPEELQESLNPISAKLNPKHQASMRDFQRLAVSQVVSSILSGRDKLYIQMATGTGKTSYVATAIVAKLFSIGKARRVLFLVDRDALADQAVKDFKDALGEEYSVKRLTISPDDRHADVLVSTVQMLAVGEKYLTYPSDFFDLIILDECHRSYFGEWHRVVEHFRKGEKKAIILGQTATPSDRETVNTDEYFGPPVFRYTYQQGVKDDILADVIYYKFATNIDIYGVHELGFDFDPEDLGRQVDVPQRNALIAEKYFEVIDYQRTKTLKKALVFAASIPHANNLRYAFIRKFNELNGLPLDDARAEEFIVSIHTGIPNSGELLREFQRIGSPIKIAVCIDMLSTGIDAPDIEVLVMARPTKSRVLYAQMKGRGARKCAETGKDRFSLIDFVDAWSVEEAIVTNELLEEEERRYEVEAEEPEKTAVATKEEAAKQAPRKEVQHREMTILDVPVWLVYSEVIEPQALDSVGRQIEHQLKAAQERLQVIHKFEQAVVSWKYLKGNEDVDEKYLEEMGFGLDALRTAYGEPQAELKDFIQVALGNKRFPTPEERRRDEVRAWAKRKGFSDEAVDFLLIFRDFKSRNPDLSADQFFKSYVVQRRGGLAKVKQLFNTIENLWKLYDEMKEAGYA